MIKINKVQQNKLLCDNAIIDALKDYNSTQLKIFYEILYRYKIEVTIKKTMDEYDHLLIDFEDMKQIIGGKKNLTYEEITDIVTGMSNKIYYYKENGAKGYITMFYQIDVEPYEKYFQIEFTEQAIPFLFNFVNKFTSINLQELQQLSKKYSQRLYELYSRRKNQGIHTFKIEDFKHYFKVPTTYRQSEINKFILTPAIKEIKEKLNIDITYKKIKKSNKVTHIEFCFKKKATPEPVENKEIKKTNNNDFDFSYWKNAK